MTTDTAPSSRQQVRLSITAGLTRITVDDKPFLILGGELHNSSGSSVTSIEHGLDRAVRMNANTALVPVSWELLEPVEGQFDFGLVRSAIDGARRRGLRLILLWFGTWKNGRSTYVPGWVKRDVDRFPRAVIANGAPVEHISPFSRNTMLSDAAAFTELMRFLASYDSEHHTVIMVQVENEVGLLGDSRDRGALAETAFAKQVPSDVIDLLRSGARLAARDPWEIHGSRTSGTWGELFGNDPRGDEAFMAHAYASYIEFVARSGYDEHPLPLYTNAWLDTEIEIPGSAVAGGQRPGTYPSGGPIVAVAPIWRRMAPTLVALAPDIYVGDFTSIAGRFRAANAGALLIPEMRRDEEGAGQIAVAVGAHGAFGVSPFGIDSGEAEELDPISDLYGLIAAVAGELNSAAGATHGFHLRGDDESQTFTVGDQQFRARKHRSWGGTDIAPHTYGIVIAVGRNEFLAVGRGFQIEPVAPPNQWVGIVSVDELIPNAGSVALGRRLNGDETVAGSAWTHPSRGHARPGGLPIASVGENSGISRCQLYSY